MKGFLSVERNQKIVLHAISITSLAIIGMCIYFRIFNKVGIYASTYSFMFIIASIQMHFKFALEKKGILLTEVLVGIVVVELMITLQLLSHAGLIDSLLANVLCVLTNLVGILIEKRIVDPK